VADAGVQLAGAQRERPGGAAGAATGAQAHDPLRRRIFRRLCLCCLEADYAKPRKELLKPDIVTVRSLVVVAMVGAALLFNHRRRQRRVAVAVAAAGGGAGGGGAPRPPWGGSRAPCP